MDYLIVHFFSELLSCLELLTVYKQAIKVTVINKVRLNLSKREILFIEPIGFLPSKAFSELFC
jgi:hypothetical protein